ncbi:hypothetical protein MMC30_000521 [Trapelia coarctata]|nr:hypothetical protein [Trapelia coarctata]
MERRSGDTPMEFEYENKGGRIDPNSPWVKNNTFPRLQNFGQTFSTLSSSPPKRSSPTRNGTIPKIPLPQTPTMKVPQFFGIREPTNPDFSSGPENQSSPEYADNEDTPEPPKRGSQAAISDNVTVQRGNKSPSKRQSFSEMFSFRRFSPGRSGFRKRHDRDVLAKKVHKRKRRELEKDVRTTYRRPSDDSSSDDASLQPPGSKTGPQEAFFPALIKIIVDQPNLPHVLTHYVQLLWNLFLCLGLMYLLYSFWAAIRQDVDKKAEESAKQTLAAMSACANEYLQNRCERTSRVPAMETLCENWENCMNQDPNKVARARISAHTFAEIFNSFIEPISYKTMSVMFTLVFGCFAISNIGFMMAKRKISPATQQPQRQPSFQHDQLGYVDAPPYTPRHEHSAFRLTQAPEAYDNRPRSPSKEYRLESPSKNYGPESPSKRYQYR